MIYNDPSSIFLYQISIRGVNEFYSNNTRVFIDFFSAMIVKRTNLFVSFYFSHQISICFFYTILKKFNEWNPESTNVFIKC